MKNKKWLLITGCIILALILFLVFFVDFKKVAPSNEVDKLIAPAINTEALEEKMELLKVESITKNEIIFTDNLNIKENERVAVWLYSEPKFLGYFKVVLENDNKKIEGLQEALENIIYDYGKHSLALTTMNGVSLGYINVNISNDKMILQNEEDTNITDEEKPTDSVNKEELIPNENDKENANINKNDTVNSNDKNEILNNGSKEEISNKPVVKEVNETEVINFTVTEQKEVNMLKGKKEIIQVGEKGEKVITYKITYDSNGKELAKEKISEKVTKEPIIQIEKVGISDFNMNADMLTEVSFGPVCTELTENEYGDKECLQSNMKYTAIKINNVYYITEIKENEVVKFKGLLKTIGTEGINLVANYNGITHYFYMSAGGGMYELLNEQTCTTYGLSCGKW